MLAVGSGSATILEMPNGEVWLYDAGSLGGADVGRFTVWPALRDRRIRRIDAALISHPNYDHYSGLFSLWNLVTIEKAFISTHFERFAAPGDADARLLQELNERGIHIQRVHVAEQLPAPFDSRSDGVAVEFLWPPEDLPPGTSSNDTSLVLRVTYKGQRVLFTGDIEALAQQQLLKSGVDLQAEILILPHHGSVNPFTRQFIAAVDPLCVLRSSGQRHADEPAEIEAITCGRAYWNTADVGAITVLLRQGERVVQGFRTPQRLARLAGAS
jgi:competence protein ComEC